MPMWVSVPKSGDCNLSKGWPYKEAEKEENGRKKRRGSESWLSDAASSSSKLHCQLMLCSMTLRSSGLIAAHRSAMVLLPLPFPLLDPLSMRTRSASKSCIPKISPVGVIYINLRRPSAHREFRSVGVLPTDGEPHACQARCDCMLCCFCPATSKAAALCVDDPGEFKGARGGELQVGRGHSTHDDVIQAIPLEGRATKNIQER
eukprot:CAMPEP_0172684632 /NCGR_PEP_ID=MMETSP1074-20121228/19702_1 /TAXON_ID=2916 /ORGANISM="Ceratium fusus, Strain PA161109" /LENGTH=203 /DNA_ID=CAMNT_0013503677 /DNA_START=70 /DNA_END=680 /DNA_ORIENTATION=+